MCGPDSDRWTESISTPAISSASSIAFLIESTAASRLTTAPRLIPRDSATPIPTMSRLPSSMHSPTTAQTFEVPTSSPTRYRSLRATPPPFCRPDVHALAEAQVHVVDVGHALAKRRREIQIGLQPLCELLLANAHEHGVALQQHDRVAQVADVDLGDALREVGPRLERSQEPHHEPGARLVDEEPRRARRRRQP